MTVRRGRRLVVAALAPVLAVLAAFGCSSFGASTPGPADGGGADGGGAEASALDGSADGNGHPDATANLDGGGCHPVLDERFVDPGFAGWTATGVHGNVALDEVYLSAPSALSASVALAPGQSGSASLEQTLPIDPAAVGALVAGFAVKIETPNGGPIYAETGCSVAIRNAAGDATHAFVARYDTGELVAALDATFAGASAAKSAVLFGTTATGWYHVQISIGLTAVPPVVSIEVTDGTSTTKKQLTAVLPPGYLGVELVCGLGYASVKAQGSQLGVHVDDVSLATCAR